MDDKLAKVGGACPQQLVRASWWRHGPTLPARAPVSHPPHPAVTVVPTSRWPAPPPLPARYTASACIIPPDLFACLYGLLQLNDHLASRTYLVGSSATLADLVIYALVHPAAVR